MPLDQKLSFGRQRGVVWVCDVESSSSRLNDNDLADEFEEYLKRFFYVAAAAVAAANGRLIKWTGDGFLAWFKTPLERHRGGISRDVFAAATHLAMLNNTTQLGMIPKRRFILRHGITYEPDALVIERSEPNREPDLDIIGRSVVLAFRLSGIKGVHPRIVTQRALAEAALEAGDVSEFAPLKLSEQDRVKYFKGERWGTAGIYASTDKRRGFKSLAGARRYAKKTLRMLESSTVSTPRGQVGLRFIAPLENGPEWARKMHHDYGRWIRENILPVLREMADGPKPPRAR